MVDNARPVARASVLGLRPYVQGKSALAGIAAPLKLSSNESSYGPSPRAVAAFAAAASEMHRYPDGGQTELRRALAETYELDESRLVCGNGSEELIGLVIRAFVGPADEVLLSQNHFMMCPIYARTQDAHVVLAPETGDRVDVDALLARVTARTRLVAVANPNNPTGTYLPGPDIERLHRALPGNVLLLLDDAYAEYVVAADYESGIRFVARCENVVATRTFSKIHGLAGLRIGWAYAPAHVVDAVQRIRTPFNANRAAMAAAAAAVRDVEYTAGVRDAVAAAQAEIRDALAAFGLPVIPSATNFYLIDLDAVAGANAVDAAAYLERHGVIPRPVQSGHGRNALRLTVGLPAENAAALRALGGYLASVRAR